MRRKWMLPLILFAVFILLAMILPVPDAEETCRAYLSDCGYETDATVNAEPVTLPKAEERVWQDYLFMQRETGFDLAPYSGRRVIRYTFTILNYPFQGPVFANLYWADGKIVGGDIMSPALDGFMHGLPLDLL